MILTGENKSCIEDNKTTQKTASIGPSLGLLLILQKKLLLPKSSWLKKTLDKIQFLEFSMENLCTLFFYNARKQQIWYTDFQISLKVRYHTLPFQLYIYHPFQF